MEIRDTLLIAILVVIVAIFFVGNFTGAAFWNTQPLTNRLTCTEILSPNNFSVPDEVCKSTLGRDYSCVYAEIGMITNYYESSDGIGCYGVQVSQREDIKLACNLATGLSQRGCENYDGGYEPLRGDWEVGYEDNRQITCCRVIS